MQGISLPNSQSDRAPSIDSLDRLPGLQSSPDRSPIGKVKEGPPLYRRLVRTVTQFSNYTFNNVSASLNT